MLKDIKVPLPDLPTQRAIVADIEAELALVASNRELIRRMETKVNAAIDRVWGVPVPVQAWGNGVTTPTATSLAS